MTAADDLQQQVHEHQRQLSDYVDLLDHSLHIGETVPPPPTAVRRLLGLNGSTSPAGPTTGLRAKLLSRADLRNLPAPSPLIENTLDLRTIALLYGYWGSLKSFVALDWACSIATGKAWQGRPVQQGKALYVAAEGAYGLDRRVAAWETAWHREVADLTVYPHPVDLLDKGAVRELEQLCAEELYRFVTFDTVARCIPGADENNAGPMGLVVDALDRVMRATAGGTVLGVHHTGKDKVTNRGSSALESGVDTAYRTEGDALLMALTREKRKDGPREDRHQLRLLPVGDSCVIESHGNDLGTFSRQGATVEAVLWDVFGTNGASRAELRDAAVAAGLSRTDAYRGMKTLAGTGKVRVGGTPDRPHYWPLGDREDK